MKPVTSMKRHIDAVGPYETTKKETVETRSGL